MKELITLIPYCDGIRKGLKPEKTLGSPFPFSPTESSTMSGSGESAQMWGHHTVERPPNRDSSSFMDPELRSRGRRARSGKIQGNG